MGGIQDKPEWELERIKSQLLEKHQLATGETPPETILDLI